MKQNRKLRSALVFRLIASIVLAGMVTPVTAEPTALKVMVRASDAKFIGSGVGGMHVIVKDSHTGELLDAGSITGGTGDTAALMTQGQTRGFVVTQEGDAAFTARLDIERPRRVTVSVTGPLQEEQSVQATSVSLWVVPGRDQVSPGVLLQLPGLLTTLDRVEQTGGTLSVTAHVTMICGCPIDEGGLWPASDFSVMAVLYRSGTRVAGAPLEFTGRTNTFAGTLEAPAAGDYVLSIQAYQISRGNTGVHETPVNVQ